MFKQWMAGLLALWSVGAWAEDQLCAVVLIEIAQELSFERQAFEATMRINNDRKGDRFIFDAPCFLIAGD